MKITEQPVPDVVRSSAGRSDGLHVSEIIRDLENRITKPGQRNKRENMTEEERARLDRFALLGFTWETVLSEHMEQRMSPLVEDPATLLPQTEIEKDGIFMTPDSFDAATATLHEYKCTWKSAARFDNLEVEFWAWLVQIKAYCWAWHINRCRLVVFFVMGDYRSNFPIIKHVLLEFTEEELEENWEMLKRHAEKMRAEAQASEAALETA